MNLYRALKLQKRRYFRYNKEGSRLHTLNYPNTVLQEKKITFVFHVTLYTNTSFSLRAFSAVQHWLFPAF